jgi:hypothetical protein
MEFVDNALRVLREADWPAIGNTALFVANQPIVCALLPAIVGWILAVRVRNVVEKNADALETRRLEGELADTAPSTGAEATGNAGVAAAQPEGEQSSQPAENFAQGAKWIAELKAVVDQKAKNARDGRRRRRYGNIDRYDYRVLVLALAEGGEIGPEERDEIVQAFTKWTRFRNGRVNVPQNVVADIRRLVRKLRRAPAEEVAMPTEPQST